MTEPDGEVAGNCRVGIPQDKDQEGEFGKVTHNKETYAAYGGDKRLMRKDIECACDGE